ncbi:MAG: hypothetical protein IPF54_02065 [Draconibacterium sp.]|nr:hypothetical protein [Draconibacterium sp.]
MKIIKYLVLFNYFFYLFLNPVSAIKIEKTGIEKGLSNNNVISITQDRDGFIWVCTKDGLNRFDSNIFKVFKSSDADTNSICSDVLNFVYADKYDDVVWIASEKMVLMPTITKHINLPIMSMTIQIQGKTTWLQTE